MVENSFIPPFLNLPFKVYPPFEIRRGRYRWIFKTMIFSLMIPNPLNLFPIVRKIEMGI
jgi:hypothetical protein|tara:strand:- start:99 stop:275 length:177 start_codon:yes stop_codon:yes gene_type:complete